MRFAVPDLADAPHQVRHPDKLFIGGEWVDPSSAGRLHIISPVSEQDLGSVAEAVEADVNCAVAAARRAFDAGPWSRLAPAERAIKLREFGRLLMQKAEAFAYLWTLQTGAPNSFTSRVSVAVGMTMTYYADLIERWADAEVRTRDFNQGYGVVVREPVGVVAAIVPWNAPSYLAMVKLAPALAAGCTVVIKPAPETPLDAYIIAECAEAAGLPPGTVNIVAANRNASDALIRHRGVDKVTFTGSTGTGQHIVRVCADRLARVTLELGGKSAAIVLDDIAVEDAVPGIVSQVSGNCGQVCVTLSRLLVPAGREAEFEAALAAAFKAVKMGDPFDPETQVGTLAMKRQFDRVSDYVAIGQAEGARLITGGGRPAQFDQGYFFEPTLLAGADNSMRIAREEIFGPVITMIPYRTVDEAVAIANDSDYGLHGALFTNDIDRAYALSRRLQTGTIGLCGNSMDLTFPFGGWKQSGVGREGGIEGLNGFTELKTVFLPEIPAVLA